MAMPVIRDGIREPKKFQSSQERLRAEYEAQALYPFDHFGVKPAKPGREGLVLAVLEVYQLLDGRLPWNPGDRLIPDNADDGVSIDYVIRELLESLMVDAALDLGIPPDAYRRILTRVEKYAGSDARRRGIDSAILARLANGKPAGKPRSEPASKSRSVADLMDDLATRWGNDQ
jgi:hypothetical protein